MPFEYEYKGQVIESDRELSPDEIKKAFNYVDTGTAPPTEEKGFLDRLGESSNLVKALKSPLETIGSVAKSAMPQNIPEAIFPPLAASRMAMEGLGNYGEDVAEREARLFERMNEDPENAKLRAAQMLIAPIPFAGKLVEPLEEDITRGNLSGAAGSVGGVALDALGARVAPAVAKAPGQVASAVSKATLKPLGQKIYSNAVAREAARKSLPHVPNPTPYIRNPYNPIMLGQDALRAGTNIAKSSRVEALQKALGKKLNPDVVGVGKNKPGVSGVFGDTQSIEDLIDADDSFKFKREHELERIMNQERLNYSPRDFQNPVDRALSLEDFDPSVASDTPLNRALKAREAPIPEFIPPQPAPRRGISAERGKLANYDPQGINPDALEPPIPPPLEEQWAQQLIEEEAGGRPALAPVDSIDKSPFGSQNPKGSQDFTSDQILAEQNRIQRMLQPEAELPKIETPPDAPVIEKPVDAPVIEGIREQLIAKGIPESLVDKMTPEQMQMALQRKGTRASGTNPRAMISR